MATNMSNRIANDPKFERTRENMAEFERAGKAGKLLNDSLRALTNTANDTRLTARLSKQMSKVLNGDKVNGRGLRTIASGDLMQLRGFDFNNAAKLSTVFFAPYSTTVDRATGSLSIAVPAFTPKTMLKAPPGTTHFALVSGASAVDFDANLQTGVQSATAELVYGNQLEAEINITHALPANSTQPLFLALGVRYFQQVNDEFYPLNSAKYNALSIVAVNLAA